MKRLGRAKDQPGKNMRKSLKKSLRKNKRWKHIDWKDAFAPIQRRVFFRHMLQYLTIGMLSSMGVALLLVGLSFFMAIEHLWVVCLLIGLIMISIVLIIGWLKRPSTYEAARITDRLGLQEKVLTACELDDRADEMANLQRRDAIESLSRFDKKRISLQIPKHHGYGIILMVVSLVILNLIPNPMDHLIEQKKELKANIQGQLEELKEAEEKLEAEGTLNEEQQQELAKLVDELARQLKNTGDYREALKEISKAEDELATLIDQIREESMGQLAKQLGSLEETSALAKALSDKSLARMETALEQLEAQLKQGENKEELADKLKEALEKAAQSMPEGSMKENLTAAANRLSNGQSEAALDQLGEALNQAVNASNAMGDVKYALQQMRSSIARSAGESQYAQNPGNQSEQQSSNNGNESNGNQAGENPSSGNTNNGNSGQGSDAGQNGPDGQNGQGTGNGEGQGSGSGVGTGTTNQSSGQGGSSTTGNQNGNNQMGEEHAQTVYEQIYAPERLGDGGEITNVPGQQTGHGEIITEDGGRGVGDVSGFIPYQDVYQEYRNEAMNSMDRRTLPPHIQAMVREYFDALGD